MSETDRAKAPQRPPRRINWLLTGSLMLNTLLAGLFIGQFLAGGPGRGAPPADGPPPGGDARIAARILENVEPERRAEVRRTFLAAMREARPGFAERRAAQLALREAMVADPFDAERLSAAFADLRAREAAMEEAVQAALVDQFASLSLEERRAVAKALERGRRGKGRERFRRWRE